MNKKTVIILSGTLWLCIGVFLLTLGINLLVQGTQTENFIQNHYPWLESLAPHMGGLENAVTVLMAVALLIGYLKGKFVLAKTAQRILTRIHSLQAPIKLAQVFTPKYMALIGSMMLLGMMIKFFGVPSDIRGTIDVAVGSALINGSMFYFRESFTRKIA